MRTSKAVGRRGDWFATVDGETLPCVHQHWMHGTLYHDPHANPGELIWNRLIDGIRTTRKVILTSDKATKTLEGIGFERTGYIAVFEVDDIDVAGTHLRFRITKRLQDLE